MSYYTIDELDAMPVGESIQDHEGRTWEKEPGGGERPWFSETRGYYSSYMLGPMAIPKPVPVGSPVFEDKPTSPAPALGELVALRESYRKSWEATEMMSLDHAEKLDQIDRLIAERMGWAS